MEVDHIFICTQYGAPEAEILKTFGLTEGSSNRHSGQGTANRRFFFKNLFIELLWLENPEEAQSETTNPTMLYDRLISQSDRISPFGICFRPKNILDRTVKFASWSYKPAYLPQHLEVHIAQNTSLSEPMWFFLGFASRPDFNATNKQQPLQHHHGLSEITSIQVTIPELNKSLTLKELQQLQGLNLVDGTEHILELIFDHEKNGRTHDFRPTLPMIFKY